MFDLESKENIEKSKDKKGCVSDHTCNAVDDCIQMKASQKLLAIGGVFMGEGAKRGWFQGWEPEMFITDVKWD